MEDVSAEFDGATSAVDTDKLGQLQRALEEAISLEEAVSTLEGDLKVAKAALNSIKSGRLPDLMDELQMESTTFRGWSVNIKDFVSGTLPKEPERLTAALEWLEEHDGAGLIKTDLSISFGKSQHNEALATAAKLQEEGLAPLVKSGVHPQSLQAYARQRIKDGDEIDLDALGLFVGKVAKIKGPQQ